MSGCKSPKRWSKERFSSIRTTMWLIRGSEAILSLVVSRWSFSVEVRRLCDGALDARRRTLNAEEPSGEPVRDVEAGGEGRRAVGERLLCGLPGGQVCSVDLLDS